ncbi:hypothetical protein KM043_005202 [Ampulex compressa]|nr:hypothetical protein KM043_005202 [Ampulex compressa]
MVENMINKMESRYREILRQINTYFDDGGRYVSKNGDIIPVMENGVPIRKLFVSNLAERTTYKDLATLFSKYGHVESCFLKRKGGNANYAFVTFSNVDGATMARKDGNEVNIMMHNQYLRVLPADPWYQPDIQRRRYYNNEDYVRDDIAAVHIHKLNDDCLIHIFSYLPILTRYKMQKVCKRWYNFTQESLRNIKYLSLSHNTWGPPGIYFKGREKGERNTMILRGVLLSCGKLLTTIDLSALTIDFSPHTLTIIGKLCSKLQIIEATTFRSSASGIRSLAENCRDIRKLSLKISNSACDSALKNLFQVNQKLECLNLEGDVYMRGPVLHDNNLLRTSLNALPECTMKEIRLRNIVFGPDGCLIPALKKLKKLESLSILAYTSVDGDAWQAAGRYIKIIDIDLKIPTLHPFNNDWVDTIPHLMARGHLIPLLSPHQNWLH